MYSNYKIADLFSSLKIQPQLNIFLIFLCTAVKQMHPIYPFPIHHSTKSQKKFTFAYQFPSTAAMHLAYRQAGRGSTEISMKWNL